MLYDIIQIARLVFLAILLLSLSPVLTNVPELLPSLTFNKDISSSVDSDTSFWEASFQSYIQRGAWESPDILLLAEDFDWRDSLEIIIAAAYEDEILVYILADQDNFKKEAHLTLLNNQYKAQILKIPYDTPWIRDYGPIQLKALGNTIYWLDFDYPSERPHDNSVPQQLAEYMDIPVKHGDYYLEGGAIISNGRGLCAITEKSLDEASVDQTSPEELAAFKQLLGCRGLAILSALTGETTGHADIIAQFLSPDIVAVAMVDQDESSKLSAELEETVESLVATASAIGQKLSIIRLPIHIDGEYFYSYVNGTRLRNAYLIPSFRNVPLETELMAYRAIRSAIPEVKLIPVPADHMVQRGGAVHCITLGLSLPRYPYLMEHWVKEHKIVPLQFLFKTN
jgi:agmatine deiminase